MQSEEAEAAPPGYFGSHLVGVVWNYTCCFVPGSQAAGGTSVYSFPHLTKLISTAFENFEYPFYTPTTMFMVTSLLQLSQILILIKFKQFFKSIMAPPIPATDTVATQTAATNTAATSAATAGAAATPAPATGTAIASAPTPDTVATQTSASSTKEKPKNQSSTPVSVAPVHKKYTKKSVRIVKDDDEPGPSHDQGDTEGEVVTRSLSLSELRDMRKDFSRNQGEQLVTWLLRCWDRGASSLELEGREARQLGSLSREAAIDRAIGRESAACSLWRRLLSGVRDRYFFKEDIVCHPSKWTTMERGIQFLRELAVRELIYHNLDDPRTSVDPDEIECTRPMWRKFVQSAPSSYANSLAAMSWKDDEMPPVRAVANQLRQYEDNLSSPMRACVSAIERLTEKSESQFEKLLEKLSEVCEKLEDSCSPPARTNISAIRRRPHPPPAQGRWYTR
ncbi:hypothetical protein FK518_27370 [Klebsiella pneumoniae]|nr:hypothetical protein [Klebsiella pneumoniae]